MSTFLPAIPLLSDCIIAMHTYLHIQNTPHTRIHARTHAYIGVPKGDLEFDGIKVDGCGPAHNISVWYEALVKTGRKIMLENCGDNHNAWSPPTPAEVLANCDYHMYVFHDPACKSGGCYLLGSALFLLLHKLTPGFSSSPACLIFIYGQVPGKHRHCPAV